MPNPQRSGINRAIDREGKAIDPRSHEAVAWNLIGGMLAVTAARTELDDRYVALYGHLVEGLPNWGPDLHRFSQTAERYQVIGLIERGLDRIQEGLPARDEAQLCSGCRHFSMGTDGGTVGHEGRLYGWCGRPRSGSPFLPVVMVGPDPDRPDDPWNHAKPDLSGPVGHLVLPTHYCSAHQTRGGSR